MNTFVHNQKNANKMSSWRFNVSSPCTCITWLKFLFCDILQARCSILAAANPIGGRYDPSLTFAENVSKMFAMQMFVKQKIGVH